MKLNVLGLISGIAFGGILAGARLHEYDTIHSTLSFEDPYVFLFMGSAVAISAPLLWWLERRGTETPLGGTLALSRAKPEPHHLKGGALFGIGWAVAGTCPAPRTSHALIGSPAGTGSHTRHLYWARPSRTTSHARP